jgi:hypothetical protein
LLVLVRVRDWFGKLKESPCYLKQFANFLPLSNFFWKEDTEPRHNPSSSFLKQDHHFVVWSNACMYASLTFELLIMWMKFITHGTNMGDLISMDTFKYQSWGSFDFCMSRPLESPPDKIECVPHEFVQNKTILHAEKHRKPPHKKLYALESIRNLEKTWMEIHFIYLLKNYSTTHYTSEMQFSS